VDLFLDCSAAVVAGSFVDGNGRREGEFKGSMAGVADGCGIL